LQAVALDGKTVRPSSAEPDPIVHPPHDDQTVAS